MKPEKDRKELFRRLNLILDTSEKKFKCNRGRGNSDTKKLSWGRLMIYAVNSYGKLLATHELEQMHRDIEAIKEKVGI